MATDYLTQAAAVDLGSAVEHLAMMYNRVHNQAKTINELSTAKTRVLEENLILRKLLWLRHGCPFSALYGDDGEMQCSQCQIDFKRMSAEFLDEKFFHDGLAAAQADHRVKELLEKEFPTHE